MKQHFVFVAIEYIFFKNLFLLIVMALCSVYVKPSCLAKAGDHMRILKQQCSGLTFGA